MATLSPERFAAAKSAFLGIVQAVIEALNEAESIGIGLKADKMQAMVTKVLPLNMYVPMMEQLVRMGSIQQVGDVYYSKRFVFLRDVDQAAIDHETP